MVKNKYVEYALNVFTGILICVSLMLTFTVSDYYIFNKFSIYNPLFIVSQWIKKSGLLLLVLAVFLKKRSCADVVKYVLPVFAVVSLFTYGDFFDITMLTESASIEQKIYASVNEFMPKTAHMLLFFIESELMLAACALLFIRDGFKVSAKSVGYFPIAVLAVTPLNIFENFYNKNLYDIYSPEFIGDSFLLFKSFSLWHLLMIVILIAATVGIYLFLKNKDTAKQHDYLFAIAVILLIQYHSKDSVVMGDGYNVYNTIFACIPLFICNIGVYVVALSIIFKKRVLYAISFFIHSAGALTVFAYFGDGISNYGIFCGYSILYFCCTHCLLFVLAVMPSALGHYKYIHTDAIIPLIYYCLVIILAAVSSALVTSASMSFSYGGDRLENPIEPNYAFTQKNPLPIPAPSLPVRIWKCYMNMAYLIILYVVYVMLFYVVNGMYFAFLAIRRRVLHRPHALAADMGGTISSQVEAEAAVSDDDNTLL